jgi:mono/diheme cytochrome c family protein
MKKHTEHVIVVVAVLVVIAVGVGVFAYSGLYNIGADEHHWPLTYRVLQTVRDRSIHVRSEHIKVPNLENPQLILKGAGQYSAMCTECHLAPGVEDSEMREGMYPKPPNLARVHVVPQDAFWVIKHGIKMSAMPAWGDSHDDPAIWSMVAFLERLPSLSPAQYKAIVAKAPPDEDMDMQDGHDRQDQKKDASAPAMPAMPGMNPQASSPPKPPGQT